MGVPEVKFSSLSSSEWNLISLMRSVWCGRLSQIPVRDGQPALGPPMKVTRLVKLRPGQEPPAPKKVFAREAALRPEVLKLLTQVRAMKHGVIERLEVCDGLPTVAELSEPLGPRTTSTPTPAN